MVSATAIGTIRLNLGSGNRRLKVGYVNLDADPLVEPDILARVPPIPLESESVEAIYTSHLLEHLTDQEVIDLMAEVWRVLTDGGTFEARVPYALSHAGIQDPDHKSLWVAEKFLYYTAHFRYLNRPYETRFQPLEAEVGPDEVRVVLQKVLDFEPCGCPLYHEEGG